MVQVNPDPAEENFQFNPIERVTGLFGVNDDVTGAATKVQAAGVPQEDIAVFAGQEGMRALDASGEAHGTAGKLFRLVESWVSDTSDFHAMAAAHLASGGYVIAVRVGGDDPLKARVMELLQDQGAKDVKYWHTLFVEQGSEKPHPEQS